MRRKFSPKDWWQTAQSTRSLHPQAGQRQGYCPPKLRVRPTNLCVFVPFPASLDSSASQIRPMQRCDGSRQMVLRRPIGHPKPVLRGVHARPPRTVHATPAPVRPLASSNIREAWPFARRRPSATSPQTPIAVVHIPHSPPILGCAAKCAARFRTGPVGTGHAGLGRHRDLV